MWATDGWSSLVCHELENKFGIHESQYRCLVDIKPYRYPGEEERWQIRAKVRNEMFVKLLSPQIQSLLNIRARSLAHAII